MKATFEAPATHYRLAPETWAQVVEDYMNGATAKEVAAKWKTSAGSVYRWARELHPGSKRASGDARARAHARMVEEEEGAVRALHPAGSRALKGLFAPEREGEVAAGDPAVLARTATLASGRAMTGRLWNEARALAGLAESYARLAEKGGRGGGSVETMDLGVLLEILRDADGRVSRRFAARRDGLADPDEAVKAAWIDWHTRRHQAVRHNLHELMSRAMAAERLARSLGGEPKINRTDVEIEAWAREWLSEPPTEANVHARTEIGAWPWR